MFGRWRMEGIRYMQREGFWWGWLNTYPGVYSCQHVKPWTKFYSLGKYTNISKSLEAKDSLWIVVKSPAKLTSCPLAVHQNLCLFPQGPCLVFHSPDSTSTGETTRSLPTCQQVREQTHPHCNARIPPHTHTHTAMQAWAHLPLQWKCGAISHCNERTDPSASAMWGLPLQQHQVMGPHVSEREKKVKGSWWWILAQVVDRLQWILAQV